MLRRKTILSYTGLFLIMINLPITKEFAGINRGYYRYSNLAGTLTRYEVLSQNRIISQEYVRDIGSSERFRNQYPGTNDTTIYRLFKINPLKFWRWGEYIFNWRYRLPYTDWKKIEARRGHGILKYSNSFQEF
jgi:hypothetical protein